MTKHFCLFLSLKTGALIMVVVNLFGGCIELITGSVSLYYAHDVGDRTLWVVYILMGLLALTCGILLIIGIIQDKEQYIFIFLILGFGELFIITIYSGINMFENHSLLLVFVLTVYLWYVHYSVYYFYLELSDYNKVNAGAIEITYHDKGHVNSLGPSESVENSDV